ncbi:MAG: hypothetical protein ACRD0G_07955 [Acidimicrobiales bacterium]
MARSLDFLAGDGWLREDGWPYPDADAETGELDPADPDADVDDDLVAIHAIGAHVLDGLAPLERSVLTARLGLDGGPPRSMRELQHELGLPRGELRIALGDGLAKVRTRLQER